MYNTPQCMEWLNLPGNPLHAISLVYKIGDSLLKVNIDWRVNGQSQIIYFSKEQQCSCLWVGGYVRLNKFWYSVVHGSVHFLLKQYSLYRGMMYSSGIEGVLILTQTKYIFLFIFVGVSAKRGRYFENIDNLRLSINF